MTLASEVYRAPTGRHGVYALDRGETESYAGVREFQWIGRLDEIEAFALDILAQVKALREG